jgi:peptide/nickel transport system permease protein
MTATPIPDGRNTAGDDFLSPSRGRRRRRWNASLVVGGVLTVLLLLTALVSLFYVPSDPNLPDVVNRLLPPASPGHPLGTDALGRDVVANLMIGARTSVFIGACGSFLGMLVGLVGGLAAAAGGRWLEEGVMRGADVLLSIPGIITALVLATSIGSGALTTIVALSLFFAPSFARVIRSSALGVLAEDYVTAARLYGRGRIFVLARHVLPNISGVLIIQFTLYFAVGILVEAALSYLGVGVARPTVSWGLLLNEAQDQVGVSSPLAIWPGLAIVLAVLGLNLIGDGLRDVLDPKLAKER